MGKEMKAIHRRIAAGAVVLLIAGGIWFVGTSFFFR